jgi:hypothetical protein
MLNLDQGHPAILLASVDGTKDRQSRSGSDRAPAVVDETHRRHCNVYGQGTIYTTNRLTFQISPIMVPTTVPHENRRRRQEAQTK